MATQKIRLELKQLLVQKIQRQEQQMNQLRQQSTDRNRQQQSMPIPAPLAVGRREDGDGAP
jgi:hypothetical protein